MTDVFTKVKRSEVMSRIRGCGNKSTELAMLRVFRINRITGWRRHQIVYGSPDFVFPQLRIAVFVDGCFWHGCPKHSTSPANNKDFWKAKLNSNKERDKIVTKILCKDGWKVIRIWEHELSTNNSRKLLQRLKRYFPQNL
jgi:DNA mismatch endonuclease (patch repair protein)